MKLSHSFIIISSDMTEYSFPYPNKTSEMSTEQHKQACLITRSARVHLRYICDKTLQKNGFELLDPHREEVEKKNLISVIKSRGEKQLEDFLLAFINRSEDPPVIQAMDKLLSLFMGDAIMSSVVPFTYHQHLLETCAAIRLNSALYTKLQEMKRLWCRTF